MLISLQLCKPFGHLCISSLAQIVVVYLKIFKRSQSLATDFLSKVIPTFQVIILLSSISLFLPLHAHRTQEKKAAVSPSTLRYFFENEARHTNTTVWRQSNEYLLYFWGQWICRSIFYPISIKEHDNIVFCFHKKMKINFWEKSNLSHLHLIAQNI